MIARRSEEGGRCSVRLQVAWWHGVWWLVRGSWAVTKGQDVRRKTTLRAATVPGVPGVHVRRVVCPLAQGIHQLPQHHCRLPTLLLGHAHLVARGQLHTLHPTERLVRLRRHHATYTHPATCRRLHHHRPLRRRLCLAVLAVCSQSSFYHHSSD